MFFVSARSNDLRGTQAARLEIFARVFGPTTNINKCLISPIQCDLEETVALMGFFPAKIDFLPRFEMYRTDDLNVRERLWDRLSVRNL